MSSQLRPAVRWQRTARQIVALALLSMVIGVEGMADVNKDLRKAAEKCDLAKVHQLLAKGAEATDKDDKGRTALMLAAGKGCAEVVQALLDASADAEAKDKNGLTAAMLAERNRYADIVKLLNAPRSRATVERASDIPCSSIMMKSGEKNKQERVFSASEKRIKEVVIDAMSAVGFAIKNDQGNKLDAVLKYPELGGGRKSKGEKLLLNFETVSQSGSSVIRVTGETKGGFRLRTYNWTDAVLDQAECLLSLFDLRTDEDILAESTPQPDTADQQAGQKKTLPDGTPIRLRLRRYLSANDTAIGKRIAFQVTDDVMIDGVVVIKKGAIGWGQISEAEKAKNFDRAARLNFDIDHISAVNGQNVPVRNYREGMGGTSKTKTAAKTAAVGALQGGIGILGMALTKGKNIGIRAGIEFIVFINGDQSLETQSWT